MMNLSFPSNLNSVGIFWNLFETPLPIQQYSISNILSQLKFYANSLGHIKQFTIISNISNVTISTSLYNNIKHEVSQFGGIQFYESYQHDRSELICKVWEFIYDNYHDSTNGLHVILVDRFANESPIIKPLTLRGIKISTLISPVPTFHQNNSNNSNSNNSNHNQNQNINNSIHDSFFQDSLHYNLNPYSEEISFNSNNSNNSSTNNNNSTNNNSNNSSGVSSKVIHNLNGSILSREHLQQPQPQQQTPTIPGLHFNSLSSYGNSNSVKLNLNSPPPPSNPLSGIVNSYSPLQSPNSHTPPVLNSQINQSSSSPNSQQQQQQQQQKSINSPLSLSGIISRNNSNNSSSNNSTNSSNSSISPLPSPSLSSSSSGSALSPTTLSLVLPSTNFQNGSSPITPKNLSPLSSSAPNTPKQFSTSSSQSNLINNSLSHSFSSLLTNSSIVQSPTQQPTQQQFHQILKQMEQQQQFIQQSQNHSQQSQSQQLTQKQLQQKEKQQKEKELKEQREQKEREQKELLQSLNIKYPPGLVDPVLQNLYAVIVGLKEDGFKPTFKVILPRLGTLMSTRVHRSHFERILEKARINNFNIDYTNKTIYYKDDNFGGSDPHNAEKSHFPEEVYLELINFIQASQIKLFPSRYNMVVWITSQNLPLVSKLKQGQIVELCQIAINESIVNLDETMKKMSVNQLMNEQKSITEQNNN